MGDPMNDVCRHCGEKSMAHSSELDQWCQTAESIKANAKGKRVWAETRFEPTTDQAERLREVVRELGKAERRNFEALRDVVEELKAIPEELDDDGTTHADIVNETNAAYLRPDPIDKAKLWDDLKASLLAEASRGSCPPLKYGHNSDDIVESAAEARRQLDRMEQAETLAHVRFVDTPSPRGVPAPVPPPTAETFASVAEELRRKP